MADSDLLQKMLASQKNDLDSDKEEDAVPYDPQAGTLTNIGRFLANNAMSKSAGMAGMMPVAGAVRAAAAVPELAEGAMAMGRSALAPAAEVVSPIERALASNPEAIVSGKNVFAPINAEAPLTVPQLKSKIASIAASNPDSGEINLLTRKLNTLQDMIARRNK
jgi:hypothetical protein